MNSIKKIFNLPTILIISSLFSIGNSNAQNFSTEEQKKIDSLDAIIKNPNSHDTSMAGAFLGLSEVLAYSNLDTVIPLCNKTKSIAEKLLATRQPVAVSRSLNRSLASALNNIGFIHQYKGEIDLSLEYFQKSLKLKKEIGDKMGMATSYNNIGYIHEYLGENTLALEFYQKSLKLREEIDDKEGMASSFNNIGSIHLNQGDNHLALKYYQKSLKLKKEIGDKKGMVISYNNIGYIYENQGDIPLALDYYQKCLKILEEIGDRKGIAESYNNIGFIHDNQGDNNLALDYYKKSLKIQKEINDKKGIATSFNNIGGIHEIQGDIPLALDYFQKSLNIQEEIDNKKGVAKSYKNIGSIHESQGDHHLALDYFKKSLQLNEEIEDKTGITKSLNKIGIIKLKLGELTAAKQYGYKGFQLAEELGYPELLSINAALLSKISRKQGKYNEALEMYELHIKMRDSILNEQNQKEAIQREMQYEYEKQQAIKDAEHEAQMGVHAAEKERQKTITFAVSSGLALVVLFSFFLYNRFRVTRKQKAIIEEKEKQTQIQNIEITKQKELVEEKNTEILDSITYAKRLQDAILPSTKLVSSYLLESFILYKPKDIVAGDFYFMDVLEDPNNNQNGKKLVYYVAADCTGHGVPGAMVSIVGANGLKRCIQEFGLRDPGEILDKLAEIVAENFSQSEEKIRDGMDLALCCLEMENNKTVKVHYAGANNPLWVINSNRKTLPESAKEFKEGDGFEIKANKQAIGYTENISPFTTHTFEVEEGDTLYTFSDGYPDQFGGENGKKYKSANFRKFLLSIQDENLDKQKRLVSEEFENWKGKLEQIDDVCVIGVRL